MVKNMRQTGVFRFIVILIFALGFVFGSMVVVYFFVLPRDAAVFSQGIPTNAPTPTAPSASMYAQVEAIDQVLINLYERVSPSVVHITSKTQSVGYFGVVPSEGTGSGFVLDTNGHIVTNNHVIAGATNVQVVLANGVTLDVQVIGADQYYDLAVLSVDAPANTLTPLEMGDSSQLKIGQTVIAIGNPFGLDRTMTRGLVSALDRQIQSDSGSVIGQAIQTDAAINPGNSGGPLLDLHGRVVGINAAISSPSGGSVGIGFAVPVNVVKRVVPVLISKGSYPHPSLNIQVAELGTEVNPPQSGPVQGLLIIKITSNSSAAKAGLRAAQVTIQRRQYVYTGGDIITAIDGKAISTRTNLIVTLEESHQPGDTVQMTVSRDGQTLTLPVTLSAQRG